MEGLLFSEVLMDRSLLAPSLSWVSPGGSDIETFLAYSRRFFDARWYSNSGPLCRDLEARLAELHGVRHCIVFGSNVWGLVLTARAMARPGRTTILVPFPDNQRMKDLAECSGLLVRAYDSLADLDPGYVDQASSCVALAIAGSGKADSYESYMLRRFAIRADLPLLIDSFGAGEATEDQQGASVIAAAQLYALGDPELDHGVEGAYLVTDDDHVAEEVRLSRAFGFKTHDDVCTLGTNAKMNEVHSAVLLAALDRMAMGAVPLPVPVLSEESKFQAKKMAAL